MPVVFNETSLSRLEGVNPRLRELMLETERRAANAGINFEIAEGMRTREAQAEHVAAGRSQTMNSRHLTGNAVDIYRQNPDGSANYEFEDYRPINEIASTVAAEMGIPDYVWGGDWQTLRDGVHFQVGGPSSGPAGGPAPVPVTTRMANSGGNDTVTGGAGGDRMAGLLAPQEPARRPSIWDRLEGVPILGGLADPDRRARLAMGLNSMTLNPDATFAAMQMQGIDQRAQERERAAQLSQTIAYLESIGRGDLAALAAIDPGAALGQSQGPSELEQIQLAQAQLDLEQDRAGSGRSDMRIVQGPDGNPYYEDGTPVLSGIAAPTSTIEPEGATDLRVRWEGLTPVRQFQQVVGAYQAAQSNAQLRTPSGDLALVYNMMNILDPGASVMEGDYRNATTNPGVVGAISSALAQAQGDGLSEEKRAEILAQIESAYKSKWQAYTQTSNQYEDTATRQGYDAQGTITEYRPQLPNGGAISGTQGEPGQATVPPPSTTAPPPSTTGGQQPSVSGGQQPAANAQPMPMNFAASPEAMSLAQSMGITIDELWARMPPEGHSAWLD